MYLIRRKVAQDKNINNREYFKRILISHFPLKDFIIYNSANKYFEIWNATLLVKKSLQNHLPKLWLTAML